jgi:hypothetical protein
VLEAIPGTRTKLQRLCMEACHHLSKERQGGINRGSAAPRGWLPRDHVPQPPSLRGGLWAGHGSLLSGALPQFSQVDGCLCYSFAQISVKKRLSMNFSMYLCL